MNYDLSSLVPALANHLWQSTAFAVIVWVLTILLRKNSARVRYGLWLAASVKFLIPFSLLIAVGGLLPKPTQTVAPAAYAAMHATEQPFSDFSIFQTPVAYAPTLMQRIAADSLAILLALWLVGIVVVLFVWCIRWRKACSCLRIPFPRSTDESLRFSAGWRPASMVVRACALTSR
jgi:bla regulator protein blaR1